jgi:hypothetical protein
MFGLMESGGIEWNGIESDDSVIWLCKKNNGMEWSVMELIHPIFHSS